MKPSSFTIASWNINSVRLRMPLVKKFLKQHKPDILCLQEIKCENAYFPQSDFESLGYRYMAIEGQPGYHGVATISRIPLIDVESVAYCGKADKRHVKVVVEVKLGFVGIHNFYVPAGGDIPDRNQNEKFGYKLDFLQEMKKLKSTKKKNKIDIPHILVGDLNIAPFEEDVWSHKSLLKVVSHTPIETDTLLDIMKRGKWHDAVRTMIPTPKKLYTWWSYRSPDWNAADKGRRLDHIWVAPSLIPRLHKVSVLRQARGWQQPSDHVPVMAQFKF